MSCVRHLSYFHSSRVHSCTTTIELWKKIHWNTCHQMASLVFRFYQIQFWLGLCPGTLWGSSRRSPKPPSRLGRGHSLSIPIPHSPQRLWRLAHNASPLPPPLIWTTRKKTIQIAGISIYNCIRMQILVSSLRNETLNIK